MPLRVTLTALSLLVSTGAWGESTDHQLVPELLRDARAAIESGDNTRGVKLLREMLNLRHPSPILDEISRTFEAIGWYRDARIAADLVANSEDAEPSIRALHAQRSKTLQAKAGKAFVKILPSTLWTTQRINGTVPQDVAQEVEVDIGTAVIELLSSNGHELSVLRLEPKVNRRIDLPTPSIPSKGHTVIVANEQSWRSLTVNDYQVRSDVHEIKRLHVSPGKIRLQIGIDEGRPLILELIAKPGQTLDVTQDLRAALRVRDLKVDKEMSIRNQAGPYVTTAIGALVAGAGWALYSVGSKERVESEASTLSPQESQSLTQSAHAKETSGGILLGLGITTTITGLVWYIINLARGRKAAKAVDTDGARAPATNSPPGKFLGSGPYEPGHAMW